MERDAEEVGPAATAAALGLLTERRRRWIDALLVLATIALTFVVLGYLGQLFYYFGDVLLIFFLAWLLAFILSPIARGLGRLIPGLPHAAAVVVVYVALLGSLSLLAILVANAIATSISEFIANSPRLREELPAVLAPWQARLNAVGLSQIDLTAQANAFLSNLSDYATQLVGPLQQLAVASLGALGNLVLVLILSLYMALDRERIVSFLFRLVPPAYKQEALLLETSVASSFGGFLRGQAAMGVVYGLVAALTSAFLRLDYLPITATASAILMAIPFFGPFVSWAPPVLVAVLLRPEAVLPAIVVMGIGWFVVMNFLQPRLMEEAVGIHPIVVLGSVLIGLKVAGITGAVFGIPIAAVLSAFFLHFLRLSVEPAPVAERAARRLEAREGRRVRLPREPAPGIDEEIEGAEEAAAGSERRARPAAESR